MAFAEGLKNPDATINPETGKKDPKVAQRWKDLKEYYSVVQFMLINRKTIMSMALMEKEIQSKKQPDIGLTNKLCLPSKGTNLN